MNILDLTLAFIAPVVALKRQRARTILKREYDGATVGRRGNAFRGRGSSANVEISTAFRTLRNRARDLVRNNPHATRALDIFVSHSVGTGIRAVPNTGAKGLDSKVTELWNEWCKVCDAERLQSFYGMQTLAVRSMIESGEVAIRLIDMHPDKVSKVNTAMPVPLFRLQMLEADMIDEMRDGMFAGETIGVTPETQRHRLGVGLGEYDARTGVWIHPYHPGELVTQNLVTMESTFYSCEEVMHLFKVLRPGQVRGVSWFAPILITARELTDFVDAVSVKARVEACFAAFVTNNEDSAVFEDNTGYSTGVPGDPLITELEPGMIKELRSGQDIKFGQPSSNSQVEPMLLHMMQSMAAGLGVTYDQISGDLRQANYSSLRAGGLVFRRLVETFQQHILIPKLCQPVWDRFISRALVAGQLRERAGGYPVHWVTPAWEPVNPKFDLDAEQKAVRSGRISPQEYIAEWGSDWRQVIVQWKEFNDFCEENEVFFDIQPTKVTRSGTLQPDPTAQGGGQPQGFTDSEGNDLTAENLGEGSGGSSEREELEIEGQRVVPFSRSFHGPRKR